MIDACQVDGEINKQSERMRSETIKKPETEGVRKISAGHINSNRSFKCGRCGRKRERTQDQFDYANRQRSKVRWVEVKSDLKPGGNCFKIHSDDDLLTVRLVGA